MYKENSPWNSTYVVDGIILDIMKKRFIYKDPYDEIYTIPQQFDERPCLLYTSPSPRDGLLSRMPSSA